jgi:hypothetical protein
MAREYFVARAAAVSVAGLTVTWILGVETAGKSLEEAQHAVAPRIAPDWAKRSAPRHAAACASGRADTLAWGRLLQLRA